MERVVGPLTARLRRRLSNDRATLRVFRSIGYTTIAYAGLAIVLDPKFPFWYVVMGWFLVVGGTLAATGASFGRWAGEYTGLPLLASAFLSFAVLTFRDNGWYQGDASIMLLVSYCGIMLARWIDVRAVGRSAREQANGTR